MQRILLLITLSLLINVSCSSDKNKKKKEKFEPVKLLDITAKGQFKTLWSKKFDSSDKSYGYKLIPFIDNTNVFVASQNGNVSKLDKESGNQVWSVDLDQELSAGPGVGNSIILLGTPEGSVIALNKESGTQLWKVRLSSEILSPPIISNQLAIVRAQDGRVYGLSTEDGERKWLFDTNIPNLTLRGNSTPVVKAGRVYIGFDNGKVAAIKQESGDVIWLQNVIETKGKTEVERIVDIDGDMSLISTDLYLSSAIGKTIAVATESGRVLWSQDIGSAAGVSASRNYLYVIGSDSNAHALNRTDGTEEWKTSSYKNRLLTKPIFYLGDVITTDLEGYVHVLDGETGETIARKRMGKSSFYSHPIGSGTTLYAYNKDGTLTAFEYSR